MNRSRTLEQRILHRAEARLAEAAARLGGGDLARVEVLEACASLFGGFDLSDYRETDAIERRTTVSSALAAARAITDELERSPIHPALSLASLSREELSSGERRSTGAYYTDFRLAALLASGLVEQSGGLKTLLDPASGTGTLLVGSVLAHDKSKRAELLDEGVHAADLSGRALRGAKLALSALTDDAATVARFSRRLRVTDSLLAGPTFWHDCTPDGFSAVIGNPPWERLKLTRHEFLIGTGRKRQYGEDYPGLDASALASARARLNQYIKLVGSSRKERGELDLYRLFLGLGVDLLADGGRLAMLVPAGLIRSANTESLRRHLLDDAASLSITFSDNQPKYFAIDSRFKFVAVHATFARGARRTPISVYHANGDDRGATRSRRVIIGRVALEKLRPDLTVPEVRDEREWKIFRRMYGDPAASLAASFGDMRIVRERDMTRDRGTFSRKHSRNVLPLIEGRMVHQYRHAAKDYQAGTGRSAKWAVSFDDGTVRPQFWIDQRDLPPSVSKRVSVDRVGFCDISGQTNERTMLAARVPSGVVCNNKVPTITFAGEPEMGPRSWLWLAIANSLAFDWLLRRIITTTLNYFILRSMAYPSLTLGDQASKRLIYLAQEVDRASGHGYPGNLAEIARWRAEIDAIVFVGYRLRREDIDVVLSDFPLLDRGEPTIGQESRCSVTHEAVIQAYCHLVKQGPIPASLRLHSYYRAGAIPYIPSDFVIRGRREVFVPPSRSTQSQ